MQSLIKPVSAALLFGVWGALVLAGKAPPDAFVDAIQFALVSLGVYHASSGRVDPIAAVIQAAPAAPASPPVPEPAQAAQAAPAPADQPSIATPTAAR